MTEHEIERLGFKMRRWCSSEAMRAELPDILTALKRMKDQIRYEEMWVIVEDGCLVRLRDLAEYAPETASAAREGDLGLDP